MAKDGQVFEFDVESDRRADEVLAGERFGSPSNPQGMTNDVPDRQQQIEEAVTTPGEMPGPTAEEVEYLKRRLGEQGNEIGELRRRAAEADMLRAQMDIMARQRQAHSRSAGDIDINSIDIFQGVPADQAMLSPMERQVMNRALVALAKATQEQLESIRNETTYNAVRASSGVTEAQEAAVMSNYPWVNSLAGKERAAAIVEMAKNITRETTAPQRAATEAARGQARTAAYVESSSRVSDAASEAIEPVHQKLLRDIRAGRFKTAAEQEAALRKAGVSRVDTYGRRY